MGVDVAATRGELEAVARAAQAGGDGLGEQDLRHLYLRARRAIRAMALRNPLLSFDDLVFVRRAPSQYSHMSDQNYGWWSRPGGGIYILKGFKTAAPELVCLTPGMDGYSFGRAELSPDGRRLAFACCRYYPEVAANPRKVDKSSLPEDAFYHVYEVSLDGAGLRQLTHGKYDDFDPLYLPDGGIAFLSTRRGQAPQYTAEAAQLSLTAVLPDGYVRCGGDDYRPVPIYTLHRVDADGGNLTPLSPFESFEWNPCLSADGRVLFSRWDYVDRSNMPYLSLWSVYPDGTDPRIVYGNFTTDPYAVFEARPVPASEKLIFTASAHHSITGGSLVLLDPRRDVDGDAAITRLTPEVCFPEVEGWPNTFYCNPWPLSEDFFFACWSDKPLMSQGSQNSVSSLGLYLGDAYGNLELIYRDPALGCAYPVPLRATAAAPPHSSSVAWDGPQAGRFLLLKVHDGLATAGVAPGTVKALRIVGVPPKVQPPPNSPNLGVTSDDPGKFVLGTVPVEADGSAFFQAPSGVSLFFQALDADGVAVQTMRTATYLQPGQTLSCLGCHENRLRAPGNAVAAATAREPSLIRPGPEGSWPLRYDRLVQPVLDRRCASCHNPKGRNPHAAAIDLSTAASYDYLIGWGTPCARDVVRGAYGQGRSVPGQGVAATSPLLKILREGHHGAKLEAEDWGRLVTWLDLYAQRQGSFSDDQERRLEELRGAIAGLVLAPVGEN
jgi:hypothetical protein